MPQCTCVRGSLKVRDLVGKLADLFSEFSRLTDKRHVPSFKVDDVPLNAGLLNPHVLRILGTKTNLMVSSGD